MRSSLLDCIIFKYDFQVGKQFLLLCKANIGTRCEGSIASTHKIWRVREEFARIVAYVVTLFASIKLPLQRSILPPILHMLNDYNLAVREALTLCIEDSHTFKSLFFVLSLGVGKIVFRKVIQFAIF
ncbi:hypothetical protein ACFE04_014357 [Oxalis oulophora]